MLGRYCGWADLGSAGSEDGLGQIIESELRIIVWGPREFRMEQEIIAKVVIKVVGRRVTRAYLVGYRMIEGEVISSRRSRQSEC